MHWRVNANFIEAYRWHYVEIADSLRLERPYSFSRFFLISVVLFSALSKKDLASLAKTGLQSYVAQAAT